MQTRHNKVYLIFILFVFIVFAHTSNADPLAKTDWTLLGVDSEELVGEPGDAVNAFDDDPQTFWHTAWYSSSPPPPHQISIDLHGTYNIEGFRYLPRQDEGTNGNIGQYEFYVSEDGINWNSPVAAGTFDASAAEKLVMFTPTSGRYVRLRAVQEINDRPWTCVAELGVEVNTGAGEPNGMIASPAEDLIINVGDSVDFQGTAWDNEGDTPLSYVWHFGAGSGIPDASVEDPGSVQFNYPGQYQVTFTVTDSTGLIDPTPATRTISVHEASTAISQTNWQLLYVDSEELTGEDGAAENAFDGNPQTIWHTAYYYGSPPPPHEIQIDLGAMYDVDGFSYLPRQDDGSNGRIGQYQFYVSNDTTQWGTPVASGVFENSALEQEVNFNGRSGRFVRLVALTEASGNPWTTVAELNVFGNLSLSNQLPEGVIETPGTDVMISVGETVSFRGTGSDLDGNLPLTYHWQFGADSGIADMDVAEPGVIQFNRAGVYFVTLTVTDTQGGTDPTPATRAVTVRSATEPTVIPDWTQVSASPFGATPAAGVNNPVLTAADVTDVPADFVADPFLYHENGTWYLFVEVLNSQTGLGQIGVATSTDTIHWNYDRIVLSESFHLSYPYVFNVDGHYYMIPETNEAQSVRLYETTNFPYDWQLAATLFNGRAFVDPSVFYHDGLYWMFVGDTSNGNCYLYYSAELTSGWTEHPMSPIVRGSTATARQGGRSFVYDGNRIVRIVQQSGVYYGEQLRAFEVDTLTPTDYAEHEIPESPILSATGSGWDGAGVHNYDPWYNGSQWIIAVDGYSSAESYDWAVGIYTTAPYVSTPDGVIDRPIANTTVTVGDTIVFNGTGTDPDGNIPLSYRWNFGAGSGIADSTLEDPGAVQFNTAGVFTVTFTVTNANGVADATPATRVVTVNPANVNQAPDGMINQPSTDTTLTVGDSTYFRGTGTDPDGNTPLTYRWQFGTGSGVPDASGTEPGLVQFNTTGIFTVTFTATDAAGLSDPTPATRIITVNPAGSNQPPNGVIEVPADNVTIIVGDAVDFSGAGTDPENNLPLSYLWNFGTGAGISDATVEDPGLLVFNTAGVFTVTLSVTDATGLTDPTPPTRVITVLEATDTISQAGWNLSYADSEELAGEDGAAENAFDGDPSTIWHTEYMTLNPVPPHEIRIDLGAAYNINGFRYLPRQDGSPNGRIGQYEFYISNDPNQWDAPVASGTLLNTSLEQEVLFPVESGRFIRLRALTEVNNNPWTSIAELNVLGSFASGNLPPNGRIDEPATDLTITAGDVVSFSATGSDPDSNLPLTYFWDFGEGSGIPATAAEDPGPVQFNTTGVFTVTLTVTDALGVADPSVATRTITVRSNTGRLSQAAWQLLYADSQELVGEDGAAENAFDGNPATLWHTDYMTASPEPPHEIQIDLGATYEINGFAYLPRQDGSVNGRIGQYEFFISNDPAEWGTPVSSGTFLNTSLEQEVYFSSATGRYIRLRALTEANNNPWTTVSEINVMGSLPSGNIAPSGRIDSPATDLTINVGDVVEFNATASDPDANLPLTYLWHFGQDSGIADSTAEDPGPMQFNTPGVFRVTLTVTDALGAIDPSPAVRTITVRSNSGPLEQTLWQLRYVDSEELVGEDGAAENAFDGDPSTIWHTAWLNGSPAPPHEIQIDLGATHTIDGFRYLPRQDDGINGRIGQYEFYVSNDPLVWGPPAASGTFPDTDIEQEVTISQRSGRYIRLRAVTEANGGAWTSVAEINVLGE